MNEPDPAKARFFILSAIRLSGVALAFLGISVLAKRWLEPADVIGTAFLLAGAVEVIFVPIILVRAWRTPK